MTQDLSITRKLIWQKISPKTTEVIFVKVYLENGNFLIFSEIEEGLDTILQIEVRTKKEETAKRCFDALCSGGMDVEFDKLLQEFSKKVKIKLSCDLTDVE